MIPTLDTKKKLLDTAEKLFGEKGFEATSLRDITTEAQVNLAAVNYHFQSKDSLIDAVIQRRIAPVNCRRLKMLDAAGPDATVEQIVGAFLAPLFEMRTPALVPLFGRILSTPDLFLERVFKKHLQQTPDGFVVTEFLPKVGWAGKHNTISCAAGHHFREGRWR